MIPHKLIKALGYRWFIYYWLTSIAYAPVEFHFIWFDLWVGMYIDFPRRKVYIAPLPCCIILINVHKGQLHWCRRKVQKLVRNAEAVAKKYTEDISSSSL